jgi:hypothetical protein
MNSIIYPLTAGGNWTPRGGGRKGPRGPTNTGGRTQSVKKIKKSDIKKGNKVLRHVKTTKPIRVGKKRIRVVKK